MKQKVTNFFPKITEQSGLAFISTVIMMISTHLYMFTNKIVNHDDVNRLLVGDTDEIKIQHGRWAGVIFDRVSGSFVGIPYIMGFISILAFAGTAVMLLSIFQVHKKITTVLLCGLLCTFPVSANIFLYSYIADVYFISMFLALWGVWLILQGKTVQAALGVMLLTLSCGCYQAFWCLGMAVLFLYFLLEFLELEEEWKAFVVKAAKCLAMAVISLILYLLINKIVQSMTGYGATAYEGLDSMGQYDGVIGLLKVIAAAYYEFIRFFYMKGSFVVSYPCIALNLLLTLVVVVLLVRKAREKKRQIWYRAIFLLFIALIPMASNLVSVVSMNKTHALMQYAFLLPYFLCLLLLDKSDEKKDNGDNRDSRIRIMEAAAFISYIMLGIIVYKGYLTDNEAYFRQQLNYEATYSYTLRMLLRIEEMDGYEPSTKIAFINEHPQKTDHITIMLENYPDEMAYFDYLNDMSGTEPHTFVKRANDIADFCKYYHGYDLQLVEKEQFEELAQTEAFQKMQAYPQEGSMQYIQGVLVIKLPNEKE